VRAIVWADGFRPFAETKGQKSQGRNNLKFVDINDLETGRLRRRSCKLRRTGGQYPGMKVSMIRNLHNEMNKYFNKHSIKCAKCLFVWR
jgi:hypothetical protein